MLRILLIHRDLPPDSLTGAAIQVHRLATGLTRLGYDVSVATTSRPSDAAYHILPLPYPPFQHAILSTFFNSVKRIAIPWSLRHLETSGFDVVHIHGDGGFLRVQSNFVRTFHGTAKLEMVRASTLKGKLAQWLSWQMEKREIRQYAKTGKAVSVSAHVQNYLSAISTIIPNMLPPATNQTAVKKSAMPTLLFLGSIRSRKQGEWAYRLLDGLIKKISGLRMNYVCKNIAEEQAYVAAVHGHQLQRNLNYYSKIPDEELTRLYQSSWIYLNLSAYEGFGVPAIEAMEMGCQVVSTRTPGSQELFGNKSPAIFITPDNAEAALLELLENPERLTANAEISKAFVRRFNWKSVCHQYENLYKALIKPPVQI